jgi:hypothetical protein
MQPVAVGKVTGFFIQNGQLDDARERRPDAPEQLPFPLPAFLCHPAFPSAFHR